MSLKNILASLDIGTNSTLFLLAQLDSQGKIRPLRHEVRTNDLGRGMDSNGNLSSKTIDLNLNLLRDFRRIAQDAGATEIRIAATEGLRKAGNTQLLIERAEAELGMAIRIISGQEEADLTYRGIVSGLPDLTGRILAADVGGGSTEIILGEGSQILSSISLPVGAVSLDNDNIYHDPPTPEEIESVRDECVRILSSVPNPVKNERYDLVICGGTASALASADLGLITYQPNKIACHAMTRDRIQLFIEQFSNCIVEKRRSIPGIGRRRAEIILPGTILIDTLLKILGKSEYLTSERGLRYGLLIG